MNILIQGDAMNPDGLDLIAQTTRLPVGESVPDGWRVLTGNNTDSLIARVAYRFEIKDEEPEDLETCDKCGTVLSEAGDGYDGLCGNCADQAESI